MRPETASFDLNQIKRPSCYELSLGHLADPSGGVVFSLRGEKYAQSVPYPITFDDTLI
jgi:hypothetical protein